MGFFEKIFGQKKAEDKKHYNRFEFLETYTPASWTHQGSIYESELIRAALDAHGRHAAKLMPTIQGSAKPNLRSRLAIQPNTWQTWPAFLYQLATVLYAKNNAFIVPTLGRYDEADGLAIVVPQSWELVEYQGQAYMRFTLSKGRKAAMELSRTGILTRYQMDNELFGPDNEALRSTLDLIAIQRQGITEGVKNHSNYKFMATKSNFTNDDDLAKERNRFDSYNFRGDAGGILLFPNTYKDVKQITPSQYTVNEDELKVIKSNVYDYFAVNEEIIQNSSIGDKWLAFYEGAIEWLAINASEAITRMLFTERERQFGNRVFFTANRMQYMSNSDKLAAVRDLADRGLMTRNELREILNLAPLPEPYGSQIPARGEYYDVVEGKQEGTASEKPAEPQEKGDDEDAGET